MHFYILLLSSLLYFSCNAAYVESIKKCSIKDADCLEEFLHGVYSTWTTSGFPEYEVGAFDPLKLHENDIFTLSEGFDVVVNKGTITGFKNCKITGYTIDLDKGLLAHDIFCDHLHANVDISIVGSNKLMEGMFGGKTLNNSQASGGINVEKLRAHFRLSCKVTKGDDGNTYLNISEDRHEHNFDVESIKVAFDKLYIGGNNMGPLLTEAVNSNPQMFVDHFGSRIISKVLEYLTFEYKKILSKMPTKSYITEDLSSYV